MVDGAMVVKDLCIFFVGHRGLIVFAERRILAYMVIVRNPNSNSTVVSSNGENGLDINVTHFCVILAVEKAGC